MISSVLICYFYLGSYNFIWTQEHQILTTVRFSNSIYAERDEKGKVGTIGRAMHKANRLTTQPREYTDNVDEEVSAVQEHVRFGDLKAAATKTKMNSVTLRQPNKLQ